MYHTAISTVWGKHCEQELKAGNGTSDGNDKEKGPSKPVFLTERETASMDFPGTGEFFAPGFEFLHFGSKALHSQLVPETPYGYNYVLKHSKRAYNGTIQTAEHECQQKNNRHGHKIERQKGRQELKFGHPAPPLASDSAKQQGDSNKEHRCQSYSNLS